MATSPNDYSSASPQQAGNAEYEKLLRTAQAEGWVRVIVDLLVPSDGPTSTREAIERTQDQVIREVRATEGAELSINARYTELPQIALRVNEGALEALHASSLVAGIAPDLVMGTT